MNGVKFSLVGAVGGTGLKFAFPEHRAPVVGDDRARSGATLRIGCVGEVRVREDFEARCRGRFDFELLVSGGCEVL